MLGLNARRSVVAGLGGKVGLGYRADRSITPHRAERRPTQRSANVSRKRRERCPQSPPLLPLP